MSKISVVLATHNEESTLVACLESVKDLANEIVIVDGASTDNTCEIAKKFNAKVHVTSNPSNFHINKEKALKLATCPWILQLDADERVPKALGEEIQKVSKLTKGELAAYQTGVMQNKLFEKHQSVIEERDGKLGTEGDFNGFFIPRLNNFLGKYLKHGGVYPDGVIRLVKNGFAHFPARDVHEQIEIDGRVGWLKNPLHHEDSPTFTKYIKRWKRYTTLIGQDVKKEKKPFYNFFKFFLILPVYWFLLTYVRHKGFLDGWQGFVFYLFSSLRFPAAYIKSLS